MKAFGDVEKVPGSVALRLHVSAVSIIRVALISQFVANLLHMFILIRSEVEKLFVKHLGSTDALLVHSYHIIES